MGPLELQGATLGKRQQYFNSLVNDAITNKHPFEDIVDVQENSDIDKLFKIEVACKFRNVEYILETLKSEDILLVSRAIKQSPWLITNPKYAHIINPTYLNQFLFPQMMTRATNKFLRHIKKNLKDEQRVEDFYKYYEEKYHHSTLEWLKNCPVPTIEKAVEKYCCTREHLKIYLFRRLCKRSFSILETFNKHYKSNWDKKDYLSSVTFLLPTNIDKFLNIVELLQDDNGNHAIPKLGRKYTKLVMKNCPERIVNKFEWYAMALDIPTFIQCLGKDNIRIFLMKQIRNLTYVDDHFNEWFRYNNIKNFINAMPEDGRYEFIKKYFIDREVIAEIPGEVANDNEKYNTKIPIRSGCYQRTYMEARPPRFEYKTESVHHWYRHAPFHIAFSEQKKLIMAESSAEERVTLLSILLSCAGNNMSHIQEVLQYYHRRHINEPLKYKMQFLNNLLLCTDPHKYDQTSWNILDKLFHSAEVYIESDNCVLNCVEAIILYKVLHDETVPEVIEKKFNSESTFKNKISNLNKDDKAKLFKYLFHSLENKLNHRAVTNINEFDAAILLLKKIVVLLLDWKKEVHEFPTMIDTIKEIIQLKELNAWEANNSFLLGNKNSWRKHLFEESLLLWPSEDMCLIALKEDPEMLNRHKKVVDSLRFNDKVSLKRLLRKLRIYWPHSLCTEWANEYLERLQQPGGHNAITQGLCTLLPRNKLLEVIKKYAPDNSWSEADELHLSLQKNIAKNMHWAIPHPSPDAVLDYAKGDYLQYALPSLCAVYYNISPARCRKHIVKLIDSPVSIQKHGLRLAFTKLELDEAKELFFKIWTSTKNRLVRSVIFKYTHKQLRQETYTDKAEELWQLLEIFIDNLNADDNRNIYNLLGDVDSIPLNVKSKHCLKSYIVLKALPVNNDPRYEDEARLRNLANIIASSINRLDHDLIKDILLENNNALSVIKKESRRNYIENIYAAYIISANSEEVQLQRFEKVLLPIFEKYCLMPGSVLKTTSIKHDIIHLLHAYGHEILHFIFITKVMPVMLFKTIQNELEKMFSDVENYVFLTTWKLKAIFAKCAAKELPKLDIEENHSQNETSSKNEYNKYWKQLWTLTIPEFGKQCIQALKVDTERHIFFPTIHEFFTDALDDMLCSFNVGFDDDKEKLDLSEALVCDTQFIPGHLVAIKIFPVYGMFSDNEKRKELIKYFCQHPSPEVQMNSFKAFPILSRDFL